MAALLLAAPASAAKKKIELALQEGHSGAVRTLDLSPDGTRLASGDTDGFVKIWVAMKGGRPTQGAVLAQNDLKTRGLRKKAALGTASVNRAALLGEVLADLVFASASFSQAAEERKEWGNGAFTKALLEGLAQKADRNNDGRVVLSELRTYVIDRVLDLTAGNQRPTIRRDFLEDDFPLY